MAYEDGSVDSDDKDNGGGGDGKTKVCCEDKADNDETGDNNSDVDDGGDDISNGNDANIMEVRNLESEWEKCDDIFWRRHSISSHESYIYSLHNNIKVNRACSSIRYKGLSQSR